MESPLVPSKERIVSPTDVQNLELLPIETPVTSTSSQIHRAAKNGNVDLLNSCLEENPKYLNLLDDKDMSPLHYAAQCNRREIIEKLLDAGADVNNRGKDNITPLHVASRSVNCTIAHKYRFFVKMQFACIVPGFCQRSCPGFIISCQRRLMSLIHKNI